MPIKATEAVSKEAYFFYSPQLTEKLKQASSCISKYLSSKQFGSIVFHFLYIYAWIWIHI